MTLESQQGYTDRDGSAWIRVRPGRYAIALSESDAQRLLDSGYEGATLATVERLYGPLSPLYVY